MSAEVMLRGEDWICLAECDERPREGELVLMRFPDGTHEAHIAEQGILDDWVDDCVPTHWMTMEVPDVPGASK